ncbi:hypothetical protein FE257_010856 [Aspergillus nanangensis]|uniref:Heterokaryon incompatibility domain-containing protein n=1 Tax=Aspergillus nanangensis TaxID=2582783 RepID=A0AAD4CVM4_ASPNN|nr:hypothetical protein FE257_010856 [Aspergillus nanangensis]
MDPVNADSDSSTIPSSTRAILDKYKSSFLRQDPEGSTAPSLPFTPTNLCTQCGKLLKTLEHEIGVGDSRDVAAFEDGVKNGCQACAMFLAGASSLTADWERAFDGKLYIWVTGVPNLHLPLPLQPGANTPLTFAVYPAEDIAHLISQNEVGKSTGSASSLRLARKWIWECWTNHKACRQVQASELYKPTRLLDVSGSSRTIRLREKDEIPDGVVYVTLSHCWGLHVPVKLTTGGIIQVRKEGIHLDSLGKTFQDAVEIARQLMIQYIWIDCLCIIQDDKSDWARESVVMQLVYGNSFCNIAATSSSDSRGGCFRTREPAVIRPISVALNNYTEGRVEQRHVYLTDINVWWSRFKQMPLNQRAWVVQERFLSPRVLHFDQDQLAWECNDLTACERFPNGTGDLIKEVKMRSPLKDLFQRALAAGHRGLGIHDLWRPIVQNYSSTGLTHDSDKLIAIHGVAMKIKDIFDCRYAAGLFSHNMESQLIWRVCDQNTTYRPKEPVAPSWSWAAVGGAVDPLPQWESLDGLKDEFSVKDQVRAKSPRERYYCKILNTASLGTDVGWQTSCHEALEILCCIVPCYYVTFSETQPWKECRYDFTVDRKWDFTQPIDVLTCTEDTTPEIPLPGEDWPLALHSTSSGGLGGGPSKAYKIHEGSVYSSVLVSLVAGSEETACHLKFRYDVFSDVRIARKRWLVPILESTDWTTPAMFTAVPKRIVNGLVLEQCSEGTPRFRRIGVFQVAKDDEKRFMQLCSGLDGEEEWQKDPIMVPLLGSDQKELDGMPMKQYRIMVE